MPRVWGHPEWAERFALGVLLAGFAMAAVHQGWLWRWDLVIYDAHLPLLFRTAGSDIVIVAVDEESLADLGRWPWSRDKHARLVNRLSEAGARAIALDIIFAEASRGEPDVDRQLATALRAHAKVVLPVLLEQSHRGAQLIESLPVAVLADAAGALGHVHVELDPDGIARSVYLMAGLSDPHWPSLSLAMLRLQDPDRWEALPGQRNPDALLASPRTWVRDFHTLIPFAGRPGHFPTISYARVLRGDFDPEIFRGRYVLAGVTATGLGDNLPTPVSGHDRHMSGVEFNANVLDALLHSSPVAPMGTGWRMALSGLLALLPVFLYRRFAPRWSIVLAAGLMVATLALSAVLLLGARVWFAPTAALVAYIASYPLWSWRRLVSAMRFLDRELVALHAEQASAPVALDPELHRSMAFLQRVLPLDGWALHDDEGARIAGGGTAPEQLPSTALIAGTWTREGDTLWTRLKDGPSHGCLATRWRVGASPGEPQLVLLGEVLKDLTRRPAVAPTGSGTTEVIDTRIRQVQDSTRQLRAMRRFVSDSLAQMADGVMVVSRGGQVLLANTRAAFYLTGDADGELARLAVFDALADVNVTDGHTWEDAFARVLLEGQPAQLNARHRDDRDLLVHLAPLTGADEHSAGAIVNFADISALKTSERKRNELLGFVSHDLRSPIVSVLALLELAKGKQPDAEVRHLLDRLEAYAGQTLGLAEQFLQLARAESPESVVPQDLDLVEVAHNAFEQIWMQAHGKGITMERDFEIESAWVSGDPGLLERALINLLSNAVKFSPPGSTVHLRLARRGDQFVCTVCDDGPGISSEEIATLFDRFRQMHCSGRPRERGAGLGLAIVKAVAERHGGYVSVESEPGSGSHFHLFLPAHRDDDS